MNALLDAGIYIADDEPANIKLLEAILEGVGFNSVASFPDGQALLDAIAEREPDLILLDLRMPVVDGLSCSAWPQARRRGAISRSWS